MTHQLLPAELLGTPGARRSVRDWVVDVTLCLLAVGLGVFLATGSAHAHSPGLWVLDAAGGLAALVAIWWRRRHPVAVAAIAVTAGTVSALAGGLAIVAVFNLAIRGSRREILWASAGVLASNAVFALVYPDPDSSFLVDVALGLVFTVLTVGWGLWVRAQRDLVHALHERTQQLEAEQRLREERAREAERRRIAGEMHDVLAHRISLLTVHAGALEFNPDPGNVAEAAGVIRATAHAALRDLREVIGLLREDAADGAPQPTLDAIPALVEESRAAGMKVSARIAAAGGDTTVGRTAYRVVQEGLTNARKHAPAAAVDVTVDAGDELRVRVVSRGRPGREPAPGTGTGLIGLAERVALAGGELRHGPDASGDFVLSATLPWPA
jgi:signal transduction histidine kinase